MIEQILFSVCIANYNNGRFLAETIRSIENQSYTNWEIIIVDDFSNDHSIDIYESIIDKRIKVFFNNENKGAGYTFYKAIELAKGELCGLIGAEDTLEPNALEVMVEMHKKREDASLITSRYNFCDEDLNYLWTSEKREKNEDLSYLFDRNHAAEQFSVFKMDAYKKTSGINPSIKRAVDMDLYFKLEEVGKMLFIDDVLYSYRLHQGGISQTDYKARFWHLIVVKDACERRGLNPEDVANKILGKDAINASKKYNTIINSLEYELGVKLLYPFRKIKRIIEKVFHKR